jgi:uncharacterized protein (DUF1778 family)
MKTKRKNREPIQVRLTPIERQEIDEAAGQIGLPVSSWMRVVCLEAARSKKAAAEAAGGGR